MLKKFVGRFILNYKIKRRRKAKWTWKWKWFIGTACRWIRRTFDNLCQIDLDANAQGLAGIYASSLKNRKQRERKLEEHILLSKDMNDFEKDKVLEHLKSLSKETDPLENTEEIPVNSVNTINTKVWSDSKN